MDNEQYIESGLSVGTTKIANKYEIFTEEEVDIINNKIPELDERVSIIEYEIEDINSSLDNKTQNIQQQVNNLVLGAVGDGNNAEVVQARGSYSVLNDRLNDIINNTNIYTYSLDWEQGNYSSSTGDVDSVSKIRTKTISIIPNGIDNILLCNVSNGFKYQIWQFKNGFSQGGTGMLTGYNEIAIENDADSFRIVMRREPERAIDISFGVNFNISQKIQNNDIIKIKNDIEVIKDDIENIKNKKSYILLNFDFPGYNGDIALESGNNALLRQDLLKRYGFKGTLCIKYDTIRSYNPSWLKSTINDYGWDYSFYGTGGSDGDYDTIVKPYISDMSKVADIENSLQIFINKANEWGYTYPVSYFCRNDRNGNALMTACKNIGFKLMRCVTFDGEPVPEITSLNKIPNNISIGTYENYYNDYSWNNLKAKIDEVVSNGGGLSIMTHRLWNNISNSDSQSIDNTIDNYIQLLQYLKDLSDNNLIEVITFKELYELLNPPQVKLSDIDYKRLLKRIEKLETN